MSKAMKTDRMMDAASASGAAAAIEVKDLCKQYPGFALDRVSFNVPRGLCCGFVGPNGAGKTTTLKSMLGMVRKDSGEIRLLGKPDGDITAKADIGVMFDQPYFQEDWTPIDIEAGLHPFYHSWDSDKYRQYLSRFELDPKKTFKNFSRGMKMKLAMAVNLARDTKLLLLDEPTGGLDPVARDEVLDMVQEYLIQEDRTVFFSTHITSDLERIADMIVYISRGAVSFCGEKDEWTARYCMVRGGKLAEDKKSLAIGLREHKNGYECLMDLAHIGGLPADAVIERATIDDIVVHMERKSKNV